MDITKDGLVKTISGMSLAYFQNPWFQTGPY